MQRIAARMKLDKEFFDFTMEELRVKNYQLYQFITNNQGKFYKLAEAGKLDSIVQAKKPARAKENDTV